MSIVHRVGDQEEITTLEVFERAWHTEKGAIITREESAMMERDFRAFQKYGTVPQYVARWCTKKLPHDVGFDVVH